MNRYDILETQEYYFPIPDKVLYPAGYWYSFFLYFLVFSPKNSLAS